jgi:hypothetical protein
MHLKLLVLTVTFNYVVNNEYDVDGTTFNILGSALWYDSNLTHENSNGLANSTWKFPDNSTSVGKYYSCIFSLKGKPILALTLIEYISADQKDSHKEFIVYTFNVFNKNYGNVNINIT